jgi:hypothetical protein
VFVVVVQAALTKLPAEQVVQVVQDWVSEEPLPVQAEPLLNSPPAHA